jgi:hypothetical protein
LQRAIGIALDAWTVGHLAMGEEELKEMPQPAAIAKAQQEQLSEMGVEAAILERASRSPIRYRPLSDKEVRAALKS